MALIDDFIIGPIASVYVGNADSDNVLTLLGDERTQGGRFRYEKKREWRRAANGHVQTAFCTVSMELTFYWSEDACRVAMTNSVEDPLPDIDASPSDQHYTVLLLTADEASKSSILIPDCQSLCLVENPFNKTDGTTLPITFVREERNGHIDIQFRGDYDKLAGILGLRSPI